MSSNQRYPEELRAFLDGPRRELPDDTDPMLAAVLAGDLPRVRGLLREGKTMDRRHEYGRGVWLTPFQVAVAEGDVGMVRGLMASAELERARLVALMSTLRRSLRTPRLPPGLVQRHFGGALERAERLRGAGVPDWLREVDAPFVVSADGAEEPRTLTLLALAVQYGRAEMVRFLLAEMRADASARFVAAWRPAPGGGARYPVDLTPLHAAAGWSGGHVRRKRWVHAPLRVPRNRVLDRFAVGAMRLLLDAGADAGARPDMGPPGLEEDTTPLSAALTLERAGVLLNRGAAPPGPGFYFDLLTLVEKYADKLPAHLMGAPDTVRLLWFAATRRQPEMTRFLLAQGTPVPEGLLEYVEARGTKAIRTMLGEAHRQESAGACGATDGREMRPCLWREYRTASRRYHATADPGLKQRIVERCGELLRGLRRTAPTKRKRAPQFTTN